MNWPALLRRKGKSDQSVQNAAIEGTGATAEIGVIEAAEAAATIEAAGIVAAEVAAVAVAAVVVKRLVFGFY
jgi:hypothetical protein